MAAISHEEKSFHTFEIYLSNFLLQQKWKRKLFYGKFSRIDQSYKPIYLSSAFVYLVKLKLVEVLDIQIGFGIEWWVARI